MNLESALGPSPKVSARALASRINGARSRGPRTAAGKARSARNALKHGLCARKIIVVPEEDAAAFAALEAALAQRVVSAAWRLMRADRAEAEVLEERQFTPGRLGLAVIRDGNGTRSFETLMRYRGAALAEFMRCLRTLQALQAEARAGDLAAPARRRRGRPIVPASSRGMQRPAPAAQAPRPAPVPTAKDDPANPPDRPLVPQPARHGTAVAELAAMAPTVAALLATAKRTQGTTLNQDIGLQAPQRSAA
jgi:hypothetical protein